jgi:integrase
VGELRQRGKVWWIRYYRNGRRHEESAHTTKQKVAEDLLKIREGDVAKGVPVSAAVGRLRFEEAAQDVVNDYRTNGKRSLAHAQRRITLHLAPFFGGRRMTTLSTADVRAFIAQRQDEQRNEIGDVVKASASNAEINRELALLKRMYTLAVQAGKLLYRPHIPMLDEHNVRTGFFEREAFEAVRSFLPAALQPVVTFAYLTGWRVPSEVLPLQWRQVDLQAGTVRLDPGTTKSGAGRLFPFADILPALRDVLEAQAVEANALAARDIICPWVFHRNGRRIREFRGSWQSACTAAGVPGRIVHDLRRTAVRNLVRAGVPERVSMQLTGHLTRSVFDRYDIVNEADLTEGVRKLGTSATGTIQGQSGAAARMRRLPRSS